MEKRLNCYNYIFSNCSSAGRCPFGHVIVQNKEDYYRKFEMNEDGTRDITSPKTFHIEMFSNDHEDNHQKRKKRNRAHHKSQDDDQVSFINCVHCNTLKCEKKGLVLHLNQRNEPFVCSECRGKNRMADQATTNFFDRLNVYNM
jgi:hypothetical protein